VFAYVYIFKVLISVCLFVCPIITLEPLYWYVSNFDWGTRENHRNVLSLDFEVQSWVDRLFLVPIASVLKSFNLCCLFMSDHNLWTPWPICIKFWLGNSENHGNVLISRFSVECVHFFFVKIAKIVICDQARVNGESNSEYSGYVRQKFLFYSDTLFLNI